MDAARDLRYSGVATELTRFSWMGVSHDGTMVLLEPHDHALVFVGADGTVRGTFGKQGDGPGQFGKTTLRSDTGWALRVRRLSS
jgi:hypothetical protein